MGKRNLQTGAFYHVYNFGVDKRDICLDPLDSFRFTKILEAFNTTHPFKFFELFRDEYGLVPRNTYNEITHGKDKLVSIVAFCVLDTHFHLILKQEKDGGIAKFMQKLSVGYTNYFNHRYDRSGSLFAGRYKSYEITSLACLQCLSAYVKLNHHVHEGIDRNAHVVRSSMKDYVSPDDGYGFVATEEVLHDFEGSRKAYEPFAYETLEFIQEKRKENPKFLKKELIE